MSPPKLSYPYPYFGYPSLTPMYGLGSGARQIGATALSCPRTRIGAAGRIYAYMKKEKGAYYAMDYFQKAIFGPYIVKGGKLVYG